MREIANIQQGKVDTFEELSRKWIRIIQPGIKESSYNKYQNLLRNNILPVLGPCRCWEITTEYLQDYLQILLNGTEDRRPLAPKTVRDTFSVVRRILRFAKSQGEELACDFFLLTLRSETTAPSVLSRQEHEKLVSHLLHSENLKDAGILLSLFTGLRIGELCALKWEQIHLQEGELSVVSTLQRLQDLSFQGENKTRIIISRPKSSCSERTIPLPDFLISYLTPFQEQESAFFLTGEAGKYVEPRSLANHFKKTLSRVSVRQVNFHTLRHTFATRCVETGFDIKSLSEILGHSTVNITLNRYVHPSVELKRSCMEKLETLFAE